VIYGVSASANTSCAGAGNAGTDSYVYAYNGHHMVKTSGTPPKLLKGIVGPDRQRAGHRGLRKRSPGRLGGSVFFSGLAGDRLRGGRRGRLGLAAVRAGRCRRAQQVEHGQPLADQPGEHLVDPGGTVQDGQVGPGDAQGRGVDQLRQLLDDPAGGDQLLVSLSERVRERPVRVGLAVGGRPLGVRGCVGPDARRLGVSLGQGGAPERVSLGRELRLVSVSLGRARAS
jgi:hypothetical protein